MASGFTRGTTEIVALLRPIWRHPPAPQDATLVVPHPASERRSSGDEPGT
jgi:hypothetical protein